MIDSLNENLWSLLTFFWKWVTIIYPFDHLPRTSFECIPLQKFLTIEAHLVRNRHAEKVFLKKKSWLTDSRWSVVPLSKNSSWSTLSKSTMNSLWPLQIPSLKNQRHHITARFDHFRLWWASFWIVHLNHSLQLEFFVRLRNVKLIHSTQSIKFVTLINFKAIQNHVLNF